MQKEFYDDMYRQEESYWWYVGRRRLVLALLKHFLNLKKKSRKFLDVGCGTGVLMRELSLFGESWGVDYSSKVLNYCRKRGNHSLKKADLEKKLPLKDNFFDIATCLDVLEHIKNEKLVLEELHRVIKPGGLVIVTVPAFPRLWSYWDEKVGHQRRYLLTELTNKLQKEGFTVKKAGYFNISILLPITLFRLLKSLAGKQPRKMSTDFIDVPKFVNNMLIFISNIESFFVLRTGLPFGLSIICVGKKNG